MKWNSIIVWFISAFFLLLSGGENLNSWKKVSNRTLTCQTIQGTKLTVYSIQHASIMMVINEQDVILIDPVGDLSCYQISGAKAQLILYTHEHQDHFDTKLLSHLVNPEIKIVAPPSFKPLISSHYQKNCEWIVNGQVTTWKGSTSVEVRILAVPAYNTTPDKIKYHPKGRDNGYILQIDNQKIYCSGDTEVLTGLPSGEQIDLAFVCMNSPWTMSGETALQAIQKLNPKIVCPYHFRSQNGSFQERDYFVQKITELNPTLMIYQLQWYK